MQGPDEDFRVFGKVEVSYPFTENEDTARSFDITIIGQYLYNGYGYEDPDLLRDNEQGIAFLISEDELSMDDLASLGRHYCASSFYWDSLFDTIFSIKLFWIANFTDGSGRISPEISLKPIDEIEISLSVPVTYGEERDQFTPDASTVSVAVKASFGSGSF